MKKNFVLIVLILFNFSCDSIVDSAEPPAPGTSSDEQTNQKPELIAPVNNTGDLSSNVTLEWHEIEGVSSYQVQLSEIEDFNDLLIDRTVSSVSYEISGLQNSTTYHWRVRTVTRNSDTKKADGDQVQTTTSEWSNSWNFSTAEEVESSEIPELKSPENNSTDQPVSLNLNWSEVAGTKVYKVQVSSVNNFDSTFLDEETSETSYEVTGLDYENRYFWRVKSVNEGGDSEWSETREFSTIPEDISELTSPTLVFPSDNSDHHSRSLTFEWENVTDATEYQIQVTGNENFENSLVDETVTINQLQADGFDYYTEYQWRVRALNQSGQSNWSSVNAFRTEQAPTDPGNSDSDIWVSAYMASWNHYAPPGGNWGNLPTDEIDWDAFTHMIYFAMSARPDGSLSTIADYENMSPDRIKAITEAGSQNNTPVIISIGGWGNYDGFSNAIKPANRATFVANLVELITVWGFDGIDLDMEPIRDGDVENYKATVRDLHAVLQTVDTPLTDQPLLTAALMGSHASMFAELHEYFDQINLMTYDYSGAYEGWVSWHNSPLFSGGHTFPGLSRELPSTENTLNSFLNAGVPAEKLGIGIDFYGYVWHGQVDGPHQSWTTAPNVEDNVSYYDIMDQYYTQERYNYDSEAVAAYLSISDSDPSQRKFISYDDERVVREKIRYARERNLGGAIIWELGGGHRKDQPAGQKDKLLQAVKDELN